MEYIQDPIYPEQIPEDRASAKISDGDVIWPGDIKTLDRPMNEIDAASWAMKADMANPGNSLGVSRMMTDLQNGNEDGVREVLTNDNARREKQETDAMLHSVIQDMSVNGNNFIKQMTFDGLVGQNRGIWTTDPSVVMESTWASELVNTHTPEASEKVFDAAPLAGEVLHSFAERVIRKTQIDQEVFRKFKDRYEKEMTAGGVAVDIGKQVVPWYWWMSMSEAGPEDMEVKDAWSPGGMYAEINEQFRNMNAQKSPEEYKKLREAYFEDYYKKDPLGALEFMERSLQSTDVDEAYFNLLGGIDVVSSLFGGVLGVAARGAIGGVKAGAKGAKAGVKAGVQATFVGDNAIRYLAKAKGHTDEVASLLQAQHHLAVAQSGRVVDSNVLQAVGGQSDHVVNSKTVERLIDTINGGMKQKDKNLLKNQLKEVLPEIFNLEAAMHMFPGSRTTDASLKAYEMAHSRVEQILKTMEGLKIDTLTKDQWEKAVEMVRKEFTHQDYGHLGMDAHVRDVKHIPPSSSGSFLSHNYEVEVGTMDGGYFKSQQQAANFIQKKLSKDTDAFTRQVGDSSQWAVIVPRNVDETDPALAGLKIETASPRTKPESLGDKIFSGIWNYTGFLRRGGRHLDKEIAEDVNVATLGASGMEKLWKDLSAPLKNMGWLEEERFNQFLRMQSTKMDPETKLRGAWSKSARDMEVEWMQMFGHLPSAKVTDAYWATRQFHATNLMLGNYSIQAQKTRAGLRMFQLGFIDPTDPTKSERIWTKGIEGKKLRGLDEIPFNDTSKSRNVAYVSSDPEKSEIWSHNRMSHEDRSMFRDERFTVIHLTSEGRRGLMAQNPELLEKFGGKPINYLIVEDFKQGQIPFNQIPRRDGPPRQYNAGHYASVPKLRTRTNANDEIVGHYYEGDMNVKQFGTAYEAKAYVKTYNDALKLVNKYVDGGKLPGDKQALSTYLAVHMPEENVDDFLKQFSSHGGTLPLDREAMHRPLNTSLNDGNVLQSMLEANNPFPRNKLFFEDARGSNDELYEQIDLGQLMERDSPISRYVLKGDADNPVFNEAPLLQMNPALAISRMTSDAVNGRYFDPLKIKVSQRWWREFGDLVKTDPKEWQANPMAALDRLNIRTDFVPPSNENKLRLQAARHQVRYLRNFNGLINPEQARMKVDRAKLVEWTQRKFGDKAAEFVDSRRMMITDDPATFLRGLAFHQALGLFNPIQTFVQAQTWVQIAAMEGGSAAGKASTGAILMRGLAMNSSKRITADLVKRAKSMGWKPEEFKESWEALRRVGFYNVAGEQMVKDSLDPAAVQTSFGKFLDHGLFFYREGERFSRLTAWNAAYLKWRKANPKAAFDDDAVKQVMMRADLTSNTMNRNNKAAWQHGWAAVPTQFWTWNARMMDNFFSKDITPAEKMKMLLVHSMAYGLPVGVGAAGLSMGPLPIADIIRGQLIENDIEYDDNVLTQMLIDGIPSTIIEGMSSLLPEGSGLGKLNVGQRYGTAPLEGNPLMVFGPMLDGGLPSWKGGWWQELTSGDESFTDIFLGASETAVGRVFRMGDSALGVVMDLYDPGEQSRLETTWDHVSDVIGEMGTSISNAKKAYMVAKYGYYETQSGRKMEMTVPEAAVNAIFGLTPQKFEDRWNMENIDRLENSRKDDGRKLAQGYIAKAGRALDDDDVQGYRNYLTKARTALKLHYHPNEMAGVMTKMMKSGEVGREPLDRYVKRHDLQGAEMITRIFGDSNGK